MKILFDFINKTFNELTLKELFQFETPTHPLNYIVGKRLKIETFSECQRTNYVQDQKFIVITYQDFPLYFFKK